jgi:hypothetical protein
LLLQTKETLIYTQMLNLKETANELEGMLRDIALKSGIFVPITKDLIRYKKYSVIKLEDGSWAVFHTDPKKRHIATTFLKVSAFAMCKMHEKRLSGRIREIEQNDGIFEKNYADSLIYKQTYRRTTDSVRKDTALWRYEIAHAKAKQAKQAIDSVFYASIT